MISFVVVIVTALLLPQCRSLLLLYPTQNQRLACDRPRCHQFNVAWLPQPQPQIPSLACCGRTQPGGHQQQLQRQSRFCCSQQSVVVLHQSRDWIDEVREDELLDDITAADDDEGPPVKPDMKYVPRNVLRQNQNFVAIREAAGKDLTNDLYVREPYYQPQTFWFVGKIARISDVSAEQAVCRQWNLIATHAAHLRPIELYPSRNSLEIWIAPGDSEMEVAYNRPDLIFQKIIPRRRRGGDDDDVVDTLPSKFMGFQGEMYDSGEEGFRTWRNEDGTPAKPEIQSPTAGAVPPTEEEEEEEGPRRAPSEREMVKIQEMLQDKDINVLYKEQQRRAGKLVDDDED